MASWTMVGDASRPGVVSTRMLNSTLQPAAGSVPDDSTTGLDGVKMTWFGAIGLSEFRLSAVLAYDHLEYGDGTRAHTVAA